MLRLVPAPLPARRRPVVAIGPAGDPVAETGLPLAGDTPGRAGAAATKKDDPADAADDADDTDADDEPLWSAVRRPVADTDGEYRELPWPSAVAGPMPAELRVPAAEADAAAAPGPMCTMRRDRTVWAGNREPAL